MTTATSPRQVTAEWICTRCGSTNRRLVDAAATRAVDVCLHCHMRHEIDADTRPVRWKSRPLRS
jgi:transcription elongation factor Elf1